MTETTPSLYDNGKGEITEEELQEGSREPEVVVETTTTEGIVPNAPVSPESITKEPVFTIEDKDPVVRMTDENLKTDIAGLFLGEVKRRRKDEVASSILMVGNHFSSWIHDTNALKDATRITEEDLDTEINAEASFKKVLWLYCLQSASQNNTPNATDYVEHITDPSVRWRNGMKVGEKTYRGIVSPKNNFGRAARSEENAASVVSSLINGGNTVSVFLVHSGFSVVVKPPTIAQFIALERKIAGGQQDFGRDINALLGTHGNTLIVKAIMDLFFECLVRTSLGTIDREILTNNISYMDVGTIAWLMACSKYPNGYQIYLPCVARNNGCQHTWNEMMNIKQFYFVDHSRLNEKQMRFASKNYDKAEFEEVEEYLDEFNFEKWNTITLDDDDADFVVHFDLAHPTLAQAYVASGEWMASLEQSSNRSFARELTGKKRESYIEELRAISWALNYVQYIEKIRVVSKDDPTDVQTISERDSITNIVSDMIANVDYYSTYIQAMRTFVSMTTCVIIGIPNLKCPSCGGIHEVDDEDQLHKHLIPLDPIGLFSHLCRQFVLPYKARAEGA